MPKFIQRTNKQNSALHDLLGKHGFTNDDKAEMVFDFTNGRTEHSSAMSFDECNRMIERLGGTAFRSKQQRHTQFFPKNVVGLITAPQREKLAELKHLRNMTDEGFARLCRRTISKPAPHTVADAQKIIEAIKAMMNRDTAQREAA